MLIVAGGAVVVVAVGTIGVVDDEDTETFLGLPPFDLSMVEGGLGVALCFVMSYCTTIATPPLLILPHHRAFFFSHL